MWGRFAKWGVLAAALVAGPAARALDNPWQQPEHLRGYVPRGFSTDGTIPGAGKGPRPKPVAVPVQTQISEKPKREADLSTAIQPVVNLTPVAKLSALPRMPHGFQDPTHPVGPAEPGCAAGPRFGPYIAGLALPNR